MKYNLRGFLLKAMHDIKFALSTNYEHEIRIYNVYYIQISYIPYGSLPVFKSRFDN